MIAQVNERAVGLPPAPARVVGDGRPLIGAYQGHVEHVGWEGLTGAHAHGRLWRALHLHNRLFVRDGVMRYGLFPGVYDGGLFGVEEGWNIVALAQFGHADEAAVALRKTFFDPQFLI